MVTIKQPVKATNLGVVTIVGVGLIGGSLAYALHKHKLATHIIGVDVNVNHTKIALQLGIVNEILALKKAVAKSNFIILAIPVQAIVSILPSILNTITTQVVIDCGSTKLPILQAIANHPKAGQFVATHPMWGTEYSGPKAAKKIAFKNNAVVICSSESNSKHALQLATLLYKKIGMHLLYMTAAEHDMHTAYISHISHITSFALANTVLQKEKKATAIFELASGGFASTVRLAKSSAAMWVPIFMQNKKNILDVLMELEVQIAEFKKALLNNDAEALNELIIQANKIKKILDAKN